jgi:aryl-alcohol dehydrogenase-like predicted oxidoreductase
MNTVKVGPIRSASRLTLGGGGLGRLWGETTLDEAVATVRAAVDAGINLFDTAPSYRDCEAVIGQAFEGGFPLGLHLTTKCQLGAPPPGETAARLEASLTASLATMHADRADIFFLHSNICEDDYVYARHQDRRDAFATPWSLYVNEVIPAMEALKTRGRIAGWGITGVGVPATILKALAYDTKPAVVQAVTNLLDSAGSMRNFAEKAHPREIISEAKFHGVSVMGIRAVQAGALTAAIDRNLSENHPETKDFIRAEPFRELCAANALDPALLAHRYALDMPGVDTVVLGVKNRSELAQCVEAEARGPMPVSFLTAIDGLDLADD